MTVCIGAISPRNGAIVAVVDTMLSDDWSSVELAAVKCVPLFKGSRRRWWGMYSGSPSDFEELRHRLARVKAPKTVHDATNAVERAYDELTKHHAQRQVLSPFGLTHEKFLKEGAAMFGEAYFRELSEQCRAVKPETLTETDLLVVGFDGGNEPHIFEARRGSKCVIYDQLGFHAIGAGSWPALASLLAHDDTRSAVHLSHTIYRLCEAKFVSEIARSVGPMMTVAHIFRADGFDFALFINDKHPIRAAWAAQRKMPIPAEAIEEINRRELLALQEFDRRQRVNPEPTKPP